MSTVYERCFVWGCSQKWIMGKYLLQHLCKKKPNPAELKPLIHWTETTSIKPKQSWKLLNIHNGKPQIKWNIYKQRTKNNADNVNKIYSLICWLKKKQEIKNIKRAAACIFVNKNYIHEDNMIKLQETHSETFVTKYQNINTHLDLWFITLSILNLQNNNSNKI